MLPSTISSGWELGFPCQIPVTGGKRPIFSPLHISLPLPQYTHHSKAFADVATCPHEYASFVHWKAQILCKELLLYHLAICEFFSSLDVCEKAGTRKPESKPFASDSLEKRGKTQTSSLLLAFSHSKCLCRSPGSIPRENQRTKWMSEVMQNKIMVCFNFQLLPYKIVRL